MKIHISLLVITAIMVFTCACKKSDRIEHSSNATIFDSGALEWDGCGWVIRVDSTKDYSPVNLTDDYKHSGLKVVIDYKELGSKYQCGSNPNGTLQQIQLTHISKK